MLHSIEVQSLLGAFPWIFRGTASQMTPEAGSTKLEPRVGHFGRFGAWPGQEHEHWS